MLWGEISSTEGATHDQHSATSKPVLDMPGVVRLHGYAGWSQRDTGQLVRTHDIGKDHLPAVPADGGYKSVQVSGYAEEYADGTPIKFGVTVEAPGVELTVEQALEVANLLTVLAERIQFIQHKIDREPNRPG